MIPPSVTCSFSSIFPVWHIYFFLFRSLNLFICCLVCNFLHLFLQLICSESSISCMVTPRACLILSSVSTIISLTAVPDSISPAVTTSVCSTGRGIPWIRMFWWTTLSVSLFSGRNTYTGILGCFFTTIYGWGSHLPSSFWCPSTSQTLIKTLSLELKKPSSLPFGCSIFSSGFWPGERSHFPMYIPVTNSHAGSGHIHCSHQIC